MEDSLIEKQGHVTPEPTSCRARGAMEGQGLWETISSTESKGGPEYQRQGTEEGESDHQLFSLLSWFSKFGILF